MAATSPPTQPPESVSSPPAPNAAPYVPGLGCVEGCLRGCFFSILVLVVIACLGIAWYQMAGKAYVYSQIPSWRQMNPWVDYAVDVFAIDRWFAPEQKASVNGQGIERGTADKSALPHDIPTYPRPLREAFDVTPQYTTIFQRVARAGTAEAYFRQTMPQLGWQLGEEHTYGGTTQVIWKKNKWTCVNEFVDDETTGQVWLRCSSK